MLHCTSVIKHKTIYSHVHQVLLKLKGMAWHDNMLIVTVALFGGKLLILIYIAICK